MAAVAAAVVVAGLKRNRNAIRPSFVLWLAIRTDTRRREENKLPISTNLFRF